MIVVGIITGSKKYIWEVQFTPNVFLWLNARRCDVNWCMHCLSAMLVGDHRKSTHGVSGGVGGREAKSASHAMAEVGVRDSLLM